MRKLILLFFTTLITLVYSQLLLNGVPFEFQLAGSVSYTPTSGGINIPGYILKIGYTKHQWIGAKFMTLTANSNYDILIFRRSTTSNAGYYECTSSDFYVPEGRQSVLMADTINNMDKQASTLSDSNHFQLQMYRTGGNTNGQDWEGGQFLKICFFTSDLIFNKDNWSAQYQTCYGFTVTNYVSNWMGFEMNSQAAFDGVNSRIYGGISGPRLRLQLYIFRPNPTLNGGQVTIKIGQKINEQVGYDFQRCLTDKGDYFGNSTADLNKDLIYSGYNDNDCYVNISANSLVVYFSRFLNTHDDFDYRIGTKTNFCFLVGSNENCHSIEPQITFPRMDIESAIKTYGHSLVLSLSLLILIFFI